MSLRILFADDDPIVRSAITNSLNAHPDVDSVMAAENGMRAIEMLRSKPVDVALLDVDMPRLDGISTAAHIAKIHPSVSIVMFTSSEHDNSLGRALKAGAKGFLTKDTPINQVVEILQRVQQGEDVLSPRPTAVLIDSMRRQLQEQADTEFDDIVSGMPSYLVAVLDRLIAAKTNKEIGEELKLSDSTVKSYSSRIYADTGCRNRSALAVRALRSGYSPRSYSR